MAQLTHFPEAAPPSPQQTSQISNWLWGLMLFLSAVTAVYSSTYFFYTPAMRTSPTTLAFSAHLHYGLLAVLGSQSAHRRVDGP